MKKATRSAPMVVIARRLIEISLSISGGGNSLIQSNIGKACPYCQFPIKHDSNVVVCSRCQIPHHRECWEENNGCTTFGCQSDRNSVRYGQNPTKNILVVDFDDEEQQFNDSYRRQSSAPKRLSRSFYLWSTGLGYLGAVLFGTIGLFQLESGSDDGLVYLILALISLYTVLIIELVFLYKMWEAIQDGHARTTPGKAFGFMFIPIFNLYWHFPVYWGFAKDFNKLILRRGLSITPISEGLFLSFPILLFCSFIPFINFLTGIAYMIIHLCIINTACNKINELYAAYRHSEKRTF